MIHRELRANAAAFAQLEAGTAELGLTRLRLHDVLLWLSAGLRLTHAVALGRSDGAEIRSLSVPPRGE